MDQFTAEYPAAPILCLWDDSGGRYSGRKVVESSLARGLLRFRKATTLPLSLIVGHRAFRGEGHADWLLVGSHVFAHHVCGARWARGARSYVYVPTPARYVWAPEHDRRGDRVVARVVASALRPLDRPKAAVAGSLADNSVFVRQRMEASWGKEARAIFLRLQSASCCRFGTGG